MTNKAKKAMTIASRYREIGASPSEALEQGWSEVLDEPEPKRKRRSSSDSDEIEPIFIIAGIGALVSFWYQRKYGRWPWVSQLGARRVAPTPPIRRLAPPTGMATRAPGTPAAPVAVGAGPQAIDAVHIMTPQNEGGASTRLKMLRTGVGHQTQPGTTMQPKNDRGTVFKPASPEFEEVQVWRP